MNPLEKTSKILIVDDEPSMLDSTKNLLFSAGYDIQTASNGAEAMRILTKEPFDLVITDLIMDNVDGLTLAQHIKENYPSIEILVMTAYPNEEKIDNLENLGVHYYIFKPFNPKQLIYSVHGVLHYKRQAELRAKKDYKKSGLVGISANAHKLNEQIRLYANISLPILIIGDTGTGKELIAKGIHEAGERANQPFIPVNCATLGSLAASELFGHKSGAFTDAKKSSLGYFHAANKGVLFLDEVGELELDTQAKLLRAIDTGEISIVGEAKPTKVDVKIICATNRDIPKMITLGTFREDLYYRLRGTCIKTTPLKESLEDIPLLVYSFLENLGEVKNKNYKITLKAIEYLQRHSWPGNVRELKSTVVTLAETSPNAIIDYDDVIRFLNIKEHKLPFLYKDAKALHMQTFDKEYFSTILSLTDGKLSKCLEISGMHKKNFYDKLKSCGFKKDK